MAFALVGILLWLIKFHLYQWKKIFIIGLGFIVGCGINIYLDSHFYGNACFTPYNYFYINIVQGKAAEFGTSPWWYYIAILLALTVPLLSFFLFGLLLKGFTNVRNPYSIAIFFFILGHSLVGHKEERFVFPVLFFIIYLAAEAYRNSLETQNFIARLLRKNITGFLIRFGLLFSIILNLLFVVVFALFTYKQPVKFISVINNRLDGYKKEIYCYKQSPYCTESNLEYHFLCENKLRFKVFQDKQAFLIALAKNPNSYYSIKYEDAMNDGLVYLVQNKVGTPASSTIWSIAKWLGINYKIYIPDIWFLSNA
jgi:phosphatidylinositol glycan class B